ncbi:unnamed protein product [Lymnaea stagnalis]|uniref:Uncharacterized protein n=1 Tax=Lymnaea stagnalis TaxID=6523 RepID=A0AAV2HTL2_LYMST
MAKWNQRSSIYQVTLMFNYFIFLVYALAFCIPTWWGAGNFYGLWVDCVGTDTSIMKDCQKHAFGDDVAWYDGVRGVWVGGMACYVLAVLYSLAENCCGREGSRDYGITGILTFLAGACGAAGVITVAVELETNVTIPTAVRTLGYDHIEYYWGYMLACIASALALILALVLLITRNTTKRDKAKESRTADYVFSQPQANPYTPEYTNHGYARDDIPLANGVTYQHTPANGYAMYQSVPYNGNSLPPARNGAKYGYTGNGYDVGRPNQRHSMAESADLSNGYTPELIQAEHTLSRVQNGPRGVGDYARNDYVGGRSEYYMNGSRPY